MQGVGGVLVGLGVGVKTVVAVLVEVSAGVEPADVAQAGLVADLFENPVGVLDVDAATLAALAVARLAAGEPLAGREPLYLRRPDAAPNVVAKSALG